MPLSDYRQKRRFQTTPEPSGTVVKTQKTRFVIQLHKARAKHYDLRLELNGVLKSFAVPKGLPVRPKEKHLAVLVEDHPLDYINFEGVIPKGNYGAGTVEIYDFGEYIPLKNLNQGFKDGHIKLWLCGEKLIGLWAIVRMKGNNWLIIKENDGLGEIKLTKHKRLPFKSQQVQLATLSSALPCGKDWIYEIKYDGYRVMAFVQNKKAKLLSRNGKDYTQKLKHLANALEKLDAENFVVDGEVVVFDENGKSDFGKLQNALKTAPKTLVYVVFDILALNGEDLRRKPLINRKKQLEMLVFKADKHIVYSNYVENGEKAFDFAKEYMLEGVVAKKKEALYCGGRSEDWLKIKCGRGQEFVIGGYTTTDKNKVLSAVLVGYYSNQKLIFVGKVGVGFSDSEKISVSKKLKGLIRKTCPFSKCPNIKNAFWVSPKLLAQIEYTEITKDGYLRQPRFIGLRCDKPAKKVVLEG